MIVTTHEASTSTSECRLRGEEAAEAIAPHTQRPAVGHPNGRQAHQQRSPLHGDKKFTRTNGKTAFEVVICTGATRQEQPDTLDHSSDLARLS